ncbi:MAG: hypothetical protein LBI58_03985 [Tannerellaceae bacterium]|jgi:hypothetical protein|nr:hypothetical protein [Tannerellaceae bacterium]
MKTLKVYLLVLVLCGCVGDALSQGLMAGNVGGPREKAEAVPVAPAAAVEAEAVAPAEPAPRWRFLSPTPEAFEGEVVSEAGDDYFGERVACLKVIVERYYVYREEIVPGDPNKRTVIRKPEIYSGVRRADKYLKKEVKKGNIGLDEARRDLVHVLEVAIAALDEYDTATFEASVGRTKDDVSRQIAVFKEVELMKYN